MRTLDACFALTAFAGNLPVTISLAYGSPSEAATKAQLERLLHQYDLAPISATEPLASARGSVPGRPYTEGSGDGFWGCRA